MEEIHFKLYKRYQKEGEILAFKNGRTALQKKIKITGVLVKKIIIKIIIRRRIIPRGYQNLTLWGWQKFNLTLVRWQKEEIPLYRYKWSA